MQGPVVQPFSYDEAHPYAAGQHRGVDIGADAAGEPVVAPAAGTVSFAGTVPTNGKTVTIETAAGYSVTLTHLGSIVVAKGATVAEQDTVGTVGPSGTPEVDGSYVHLGIRVTADPNGYVDPLGLLPPAPGDTPTETTATASQPVASPAASSAPAGKPVSAAPRRPRAASARESHSEPVRTQVRVREPELVEKPRADVGTNRPEQRPAVRESASDQTSSVQRPLVEHAAPGPIGIAINRERRLTANTTPSRHELSSPLLALACNWLAAFFALGAALGVRRRRSAARPTVTAQVVRLPPPEAGLRRVSRAA